MQLLDRYLTAVKFWLPKKLRDDIIAELEANLRAEMEDRAAALGRPLAEEEIAALLKKNGPPFLVASRYRPEQRTVAFGGQLIGPAVFPFYWTALKVTLVLLLVPGMIPAVILGFLGHGHLLFKLAEAFTRVAWISLPVLLIVTLVFAAIDSAVRRFDLLQGWVKRWDPRSLPTPARQAKQIRRSSSIAGIIINSLFIVWWWNFGRIPYLVLTGTGAAIHLAPVISSLYVPVLVLAFINLAQHWINLVEPDWRWLPAATGLLTSLLGLIFLFPLLGHSPLISVSQPGGLAISARDTAVIEGLIARGVAWLWLGIMLVGLIYAWRLVWLTWQSLPRPGSGSTKNGIAPA